MKLFFILPFFIISAAAQKPYWQQEANFTISVSLNDADHTLNAFETIEYINHSPDTLRYIWFHLWPNAYKNDKTAFNEDMLKERKTEFYFSKAAAKGYINQLDFKADGSSAMMVPDSSHIDLVKIALPKPLVPGGKTVITTPFRVRLPFNFSRGGHVGHTYQVTQWFPKPAVYDRTGWHPMPYLEQGEYYSEFGRYDVEITVPQAYEVAATGVLQDEETLQQLKQKGRHTITAAPTKTWHYTQDNIHDFAWFANKNFTARYDTVKLTSGKIVEVFSYYQAGSKGWDATVGYAKDGLRQYSRWLGDYPYSTATVVQGSKKINEGGMEYPTITLITMLATGRQLDATIVHEIGHNWFEAALATNERDHPWMDEGMNSFYEKRYETEKYGNTPSTSKGLFSNKMPEDLEVMLLPTMIKLQKDQPIETTSAGLIPVNYLVVAYYKSAQWMKKLEGDMGRESFDNMMHQYYSQWKFRHPAPADFRSVAEKNSSKNLSGNFEQLHTTGPLYKEQYRPLKPAFLFNLRHSDKYSYVSIAPAIGYNHYDKAMVGLLVHNYQLPLSKIQFAGSALYATGSHKWNGFGTLSYNVYKRRYYLSTALGYLNFSADNFLTDDHVTLYQRMQRFTPSVNVTLFGKNPLSTRRFDLEWKTFLIKEDALNFETIATITDTFTQVSTTPVHSYINRFSIGVSDNRKLFPYSLTLSAEQGKQFIRTGLTGKYYFNYPDGKTGMRVRFFAGKFFYLKQKTFLTRYNNDRYLLNLSAPKGYEDYTYSSYFAGRNEFEGWKSQQTMERDGFFKVNTELLSDKVGKTDDWLMALNLSSGLPDKINPLAALSGVAPLKVFADIGTYAEAWKENPATGRFVFDAGFQVSLFSSLIDVYIPIIYSKVYSNYYKSTITEKRFLKTISFTVNLQRLKPKELVKEIPFQ